MSKSFGNYPRSIQNLIAPRHMISCRKLRPRPITPPSSYQPASNPEPDTAPDLMQKLLDLSPNMTELQSRGIKVQGSFAGRYPNCWGTTLFFAGFPSLHSVQAGEFGAWLSSPMFQNVAGWQHAEPGDIIALARELPNSDYLKEVHSFVLVGKADDMNKAMVYSKDGMFAPAMMMPMKEVLDTYRYKSEDSITFHRPRDIHMYLKENPKPLVSDYLKLLSCMHEQAMIQLASGDDNLQEPDQKKYDELGEIVEGLLKKTRAALEAGGVSKIDPIYAAVAEGLNPESTFPGRKKSQQTL